MIFLVYHFDMEKYSCCFDKWYRVDALAGTATPTDALKFPEDYEVVAAVEADDIDDVFRKTNHIEEDWTTNEGVIPTKPNGCRSTSVGDVIVDAAGNRKICASVGWKDI